MDEVFVMEFVSMVTFGASAATIALAQRRSRGRFEMTYVLQSIGRGAAFPVSVLLMFYPLSEQVRDLFSFEALKLILMVGGAYSAALALYALLKGP
jgi:hypothetical protein